MSDLLPVVSLFSGAGGLDLGVKRALGERFDHRLSVEMDKDAQQTLLANGLASEDRLFGDITKVSPERLVEAAGLKYEEAFLLAGGPPCQAFSTAGSRQGINSDTGRVVNNYFEVLAALRPRFFVFENVRGLLSAALKHVPLTERTSTRSLTEEEQLGSVMSKLILPTFKKLGYEVVFGIVNSADYGSAQVRYRVILLGSRDREFNSVSFRKQTSRSMMSLDLIPPNHHRTARYGGLKPWRTLRDGIGHLPSSVSAEDTYTYSAKRAGVFANVPPGSNWKYLMAHPEFGVPYLTQWMGAAALASGGGKEGYYRRLSWDKPAPTLTAQPQQLASSLCHPEELRPLSIPEYAALQDFPADFQFAGSKSSRYRQIGNAVPVQLGTAVGEAILGVAGIAA